MEPDDFPARLEELFKERGADPQPEVEPRSADPVASAAAPAAAAQPPRELLEPVLDLHVQLDHLHDQLEAAFAEVDERFAAVDKRQQSILGDHSEQLHAIQGIAAALERIESRVGAVEQIAPAVDLKPLIERLERIELRTVPMDLSPITDRLDRVERPIDLSSIIDQIPQPTDLTPIGELVDKRVDALARALNDTTSDLRDRLDHLEHGLRTVLPSEPPPSGADMRNAVSNGTLRLAADIAGVKADLDRLGKLVEMQAKDMGDMHALLGLLKDRFLGH
jgi:hypothetical protein